MRIKSLELQTASLETQRNFYRNVLDLPVELRDDSLRIKAGWTELTFVPSDHPGRYHFAFNIPENQFDTAMQWTASRAEILADNTGETIFSSKSWNSISLYFKDPAGNILELIARHDLKNPISGAFDGKQILCVSEVGLGTEDVPGLVEQLHTQLGILPFRGEHSDVFTAMGDDEGLLIVVKQGRIWRPDTGVSAEMLPVKAEVQVGGKDFIVQGVPYSIV